jgi:hypothetical protein
MPVKTASKRVAAPEAVRVGAAPSTATSGPPTSVPKGEEIMMKAALAASTVGRCALVVEDWNRA